MSTTEQHTFKKYDKELLKLRAQVDKMGNEVSRQLQLLQSHLEEDSMQLELDDVIDGDLSINTLESKASRLVLKLLARRAPMGSDLRFIIAASRMVNDLERIGDEVKTLARSIEATGNQPLCDHEGVRITLPEMLAMAINLLNKAQLAAINEDVDTARQMLDDSLSASGTYKKRYAELMDCMRANQSTSFAAGIDTAFQAHALKRVCDHVCNICEHIVFQVEGEDIRHEVD